MYLDLRTIVGLLTYRRLSTKLSCYLSPSPRILSYQFPAPQSICLRWSPRRGQAGCGRLWPAAPSLGSYPIKVKLTQLWGGVHIVMQTPNRICWPAGWRLGVTRATSSTGLKDGLQNEAGNGAAPNITCPAAAAEGMEPMLRYVGQANCDGYAASFGLAFSEDTIFPRVPTSQPAQACPVPCAVSHAGHRAEAEEVHEHEIGC